MAVMIDIPGVGQVEAENAASEATLQAILKQLGGKGNSPGANGNAANAAAAKSADALAKGNSKAASNSSKMGKALGTAMGTVAKFAGGVAFAAKVAVDFSNAISANLAGFSDLDNSVTNAAGKIPFFSGTFQAAAAATEKLVNATQNASNSGATFGGSVMEMSHAASRAGMTINEYGNFVRKSGEAFRLLGGDVETGRKRFDSLSKDLRKSGFMRELNNMGFTSLQVNESMARYTTILGRTNKLQGMSTKDLTKASANYMKEIDLLAKVTGEERSAVEERAQQLLADGQFQAKITGLSREAGESLQNTILGLRPQLQGVAKDILATGNATTEEAQLYAATMPDTFAKLVEFAELTEAGGVISQKQRNELNNLIATESEQKKGSFKEVAKYDAAMAKHFEKLVAGAAMGEDAVKKAAEAQDVNRIATDKVQASMEAMRRRVNEISQSFTRMLASTGIMDTLMMAFETVASFSENFLFPTLRILNSIFMPIIEVISGILNPALKVVGYLLGLFGQYVEFVMTPIRALADGIQYVTGIFKPLAEVVGINLMGAFNSVKDVVQDTFGRAISAVSSVADGVSVMLGNLNLSVESVSDFIMGSFGKALEWARDGVNYFADVLGPAVDTVSTALSWVTDKFSAMGKVFNDFYNSFSKITDVIDMFKIGITDMKIAFYELRLSLKKWADSLFMTNDEERAEQEEMQANIDLMRQGNEEKKNELKIRFAQNRYEADLKALELQKQKDLERGIRDEALDKKLIAAKKRLAEAHKNEITKIKDGVLTNAKLNAQKEAEVELNQSLSNAQDVLKDFAKNEDSFLVSPDGTVIKDTRPSVPVGQYSSARDVGVRGTIKAGDETNALDVISEQNLRQKRMDNPDYVPGKSEKEAADAAALNTQASLQIQSETLKVQHRILDALEEMSSMRA